MPKRKVGGLLGPHADHSHALRIAYMVQGESDRGCAIFCAAILCDDLEVLLRTFMRTDPASVKQSVDPLFKGYAPLATFSGRIQVAYSLHLITREMRDTLDTIRDLRNDFAHDTGPLTFEDPACRARLDTLFGGEPLKDAPKKKAINEWRKPLSDAERATRVAFLMVVAAVSGMMGSMCTSIKAGEDPRVAISRLEGSLQGRRNDVLEAFRRAVEGPSTDRVDTPH